MTKYGHIVRFQVDMNLRGYYSTQYSYIRLYLSIQEERPESQLDQPPPFTETREGKGHPQGHTIGGRARMRMQGS